MPRSHFCAGFVSKHTHEIPMKAAHVFNLCLSFNRLPQWNQIIMWIFVHYVRFFSIRFQTIRCFLLLMCFLFHFHCSVSFGRKCMANEMLVNRFSIVPSFCISGISSSLRWILSITATWPQFHFHVCLWLVRFFLSLWSWIFGVSLHIHDHRSIISAYFEKQEMHTYVWMLTVNSYQQNQQTHIYRSIYWAPINKQCIS